MTQIRCEVSTYAFERRAKVDDIVDEDLRTTCQSFVDACKQHYRDARKLTKEIKAQDLALVAALNSLDIHIRFDRIVQKQFAKHAVAIASIDLEVSLIQQVELHPRVLMHLPDDRKTLDACISTKNLIKTKHCLLSAYDELAGKALQLKQDMSSLYEQVTETGVQKTASDALSLRVETMLKEVETLTRTVLRIQQKINNQPLHALRHSSSCTAIDSSVKQYLPARSASEDVLPNYPFTEQLRHLFLHDILIHRSLQNIMEEKQNSVMPFSDYMQHVSMLEETVSNLLSRLTTLEQEILEFEQKIEENTATGLLLIELWRRDAYNEIVVKNSNLLNGLFTQFSTNECKYRTQFETEISQRDETWITREGKCICLPARFHNSTQVFFEDVVACETSTPNVESAYAVIRRDVEHYIKRISMFCDDCDAKQGDILREVPHQLSARLKREVNRLSRAVGKFGLQASPKNVTERTVAMIPPSSIQEWEVERAVVLRQLREFRERAESLEQRMEEERKLYEKSRMSLLRQVKMKEALVESKVQDVESHYMEQIQDLQTRLQAEQKEHEEDIQEWRKHYDDALQKEQRKHQRRISGFQERLTAKDVEFERLQQTTQSAPTSPRLAVQVESLQQDLARSRIECTEWKTKFEQMQQQMQSFENRTGGREQIENLTAQIDALQREEDDLKERHRMKIMQLHESFDGDLARIKELFMNESQEVSLHHEARVQNLLTEHKQALCEMKEQYEDEKEVLHIEHLAAIDELQQTHEETKRALEHAWHEKMEDVRMSMSKDATEIQKHWETKLDEAVVMQQRQLERSQAQMDVLQERLVREKEEKQQTQVMSDRWQQQYQQSDVECSRLRKTAQKARRELAQRQQEQRCEHRLARDLLSVVDPEINVDPELRLVDLLQKAIQNVSSLRTRQNVMEQIHERTYLMGFRLVIDEQSKVNK
ncbi:hypothetical protein DFQ30_006044 [Apophysomyces sp. BC1015]|nr:hypothetical protein DFQ30_006044 [Apophysomyces sp. BC1015]